MSLKEVIQQERTSFRIRGKLVPEEEKCALRITEDQLKAAFALFDPAGTQFLKLDELPLVFRALGAELREDTLISVTQKFQSEADEDGRIPSARFSEILKEVTPARNSEAEAVHVFGMIDSEKKGFIDPAALKAALLKADARVSDDEIIEALKYCDVDGNGEVDLKDWVEVMNFTTELSL